MLQNAWKMSPKPIISLSSRLAVFTVFHTPHGTGRRATPMEHGVVIVLTPRSFSPRGTGHTFRYMRYGYTSLRVVVSVSYAIFLYSKSSKNMP